MMPRSTEPAARRALVAGGTGLVGGALLALLREDPRYGHVLSLSRRPVGQDGRIETRVVSFDGLGAYDFPPVDDAFCCLGTTRRTAGSAAAFRLVDLDYVTAYAVAARRAGASRFLLVSSAGADRRSRLLYPRTKGEAEASVRAVGFPTLVIVRPSLLIGQRAEARPIEGLAQMAGRLLAPAMVGPLRGIRPVHARAVAAALVRMAATAPPGVTVLASDAIDTD